MTLKFDRWPWKTIGRLFYAASSFVHHFIAIIKLKLELQSGNAQFGFKVDDFFSLVTLKFDPKQVVELSTNYVFCSAIDFFYVVYFNALFIIYRALGLIPGAVPTVQALERKRRQPGHQSFPRDHDDYTKRPRREMSTTGEFGESSFLWPQVAGRTLNKRTYTWGKATTLGKLRKICHNYRVSKKTDNPFKRGVFH